MMSRNKSHVRTIDEVLDKIKDLKGLKKDTDLAQLLRVKQNTITTWRSRKTIPYDVLYRFCDEFEIDLTWLLTGQITTKYIDVDGQRALVMAGGEPGLYKQAPFVGEDKVKFNIVDDDLNQKILLMLEDMPEDDRREILKHIQEKKLLKELLNERKVKEV